MPNNNPYPQSAVLSYQPGEVNPPGTPGSGTYNYNSTSNQNSLGTRGALPYGINSNGGDGAYTRNVTENELVRNQLNSLLDENGQYIQNARQSGLNFAANRGLLNSNMAAESSQRAAIESALPIAGSDANAYRGAASENLSGLNQIVTSKMALAGANAQAAVQVASSRISSEGALQRQRENLAYEGEQRGLDRAFTQLRDYVGYQYDIGRQNNQYGNALGLQNNQYANVTRSNIQQYAARTGIDFQAQRVNFYNGLMTQAMENPDIWTPEAVGGFLSTYLPVYDEFSNQFDEWLFYFLGGG